MSLLDKFRNYMLGVEEDETEIDETTERAYPEESRQRIRETESVSKSRDADRTDYSSLKKKNNADNVLSLHSPVEAEDAKGRIVISRPLTVTGAPDVSDNLKKNMISVVNLEGIDRADAQRIADFLGGVSYALNCSIERISNDIFIIAPSQVGISNELREEIKTTKSMVPWISAFK